jgi:Ala-tRNA(Pro) deacylase
LAVIYTLARALDEAGVRFEVLPHRRSNSAIGEAVALALPPEIVAKTVIVTTPSGNVRAVVSATDHVDIRRLADHLDLAKSDVRLATEGELAVEYPMFEVGAVPPLGGERRDPVVIDRVLAAAESVVFDAGTHAESVRVATAALIRASEADVADIVAFDA